MKRFLIPIIFIACNSYAAGIQKWVDKSGNVHYGDNPPATTQTESISVNRPPSNPGRPLPRFTASPGEDKKSTDKTAQKKQQPDITPEAKKEICEKARTDINTINGSNIIRVRQKDGTERTLTDKEIDERRIQLEKDIKQHCN